MAGKIGVDRVVALDEMTGARQSRFSRDRYYDRKCTIGRRQFSARHSSCLSSVERYIVNVVGSIR